jgi:hypothetical protein
MANSYVPLIRRAVRVLSRAANWRCPLCDTWNADTDSVCHCCG